MAAGRYDFTIEQGATLTRSVTWQDSTGAAIDLTAYTISGKIKRKTSDAQALVALTITVTNAAAGQFTFSLTAAQTALLPVKHGLDGQKELLECVYDIEAVTGSTVYRILEGVCSISPEVNK